MNPVNWFEIPVKDVNRAKTFYEAVFDMELTLENMGEWKMAWFKGEKGAPGAMGTLMESKGYEPSKTATLVYFSVDSIDQTLEKVEKNSGKVMLPKKDIGEHGFIAHFEDSEGNRVAVHSMN